MPLVILTDTDFIPITQVRILGVNAIDQHSVTAPQIDNPIAVLFATDLQVPARDRLKHLRDGDIVAVPASANAGDIAQSERFLPAICPMNHDLGVLEK